MKPHELYDLTLEEYNAYIIGARLRDQKRRESDLTLAYLIAQFNNAKKIKPLDHYIREMKRVNGYIVKDTTPVDVEASQALADYIDSLDIIL